jgi:hypothetical protein
MVILARELPIFFPFLDMAAPRVFLELAETFPPPQMFVNTSQSSGFPRLCQNDRNLALLSWVLDNILEKVKRM